MDELEAIRQKKILELKKKLAQQRALQEKMKQKNNVQKEIDKRTQLLLYLIEPDGLEYLKSLHSLKPHIAKEIEDIIIALYLQGYLARKVNRIDIRRLEKKLTGEGPTIYIKRRGEDLVKFEKVFKEKIDKEE